MHHHAPSAPTAALRAAAWALAAGVAAGVAGCASVSPDDTLAAARQRLPGSGGAALTLQHLESQRLAAVAATNQLLDQPVDAAAAQRLHLLASPALQALLAEAWATDLAAQASARPMMPQLTWERLVNGSQPDITRTLGLNLTDWLLWPLRSRVVQHRTEAQRLSLTRQVLAQAQLVRQQWVRAVAARELLVYHQQVQQATQASADLADRMQAAGHFNRLRQAREQAFAVEAGTRMLMAEQAAVSEREALIRLLGLRGDQVQRLKLPDRLPALPEQARSAESVNADLAPGLDVVMAQQQLAARLDEEPLGLGLVELDAAIKRSSTGNGSGHGMELGLRLPWLDVGANTRAHLSARQLAALNRVHQTQVEASSLLRERYAAYRAAFTIASQTRQRLLPLRERIADETLLQYNGMLVSVFELLAETRAQVNTVITTIEAQRDFWLADAALQAAIDGVPAGGAGGPPSWPGAAAANPEPAGHGS